MADSASPNDPISIPDRFEGLLRGAKGELRSIIVPVDHSLGEIDRLHTEMKAAHRGAFRVLRGASGAGKSTFLHTVGLFREGVETLSVPPNVDLRAFLRESRNRLVGLRIFVLEEREAAISYTDPELETMLHSINGFIRSGEGEQSLVVWPCNTDALRDRVTALAEAVGAEALLGVGEPAFAFSGPERSQFRSIAETTIAVLNQGATFSDLGLDAETVDNLVRQSNTIGAFLGRLRQEIGRRQQNIERLVEREKCKLWVIVAAGNDPGPDVSALTRGRYAAVDIERLLTSTEANIIKTLKENPDQLGILGTVLDAKIFHLPVAAALSIMRAFADETLKTRMKSAGLSVNPSDEADALLRLRATELAQVLNAGALGTLTRGAKIGSNTIDAFAKLAGIASTNDALLNKAIGCALQSAGLISSFLVEQDFGSGLTRRTDLVCVLPSGEKVRAEVMWRARTGRAEIANYTLTKLYNYGKTIGFLT